MILKCRFCGSPVELWRMLQFPTSEKQAIKKCKWESLSPKKDQESDAGNLLHLSSDKVHRTSCRSSRLVAAYPPVLDKTLCQRINTKYWNQSTKRRASVTLGKLERIMTALPLFLPSLCCFLCAASSCLSCCFAVIQPTSWWWLKNYDPRRGQTDGQQDTLTGSGWWYR